MAHQQAKIRRPWVLFVLVFALCLLPALAHLTGIELHTGLKEQKQLLFDAMRYNTMDSWDLGLLRAVVSYTVLEWTVAVLALALALLSYAHFRVKQDTDSLLISVSTFWMGAIVVVYLLGFHGFLAPVNNMGDFVRFSWTASQLFLAGLLILAALLHKKIDNTLEERHVVAILVGLSGLAFALILFSSRAAALPVWVRPQGLFVRPLEVPSLILFILALTVLLPRVHHYRRSIFSFALWLCALPLVASQIYMVFVSTTLFDNGYTAAQLTRASAFVVILGGLILDYIDTCRHEMELQERIHRVDRLVAMGMLAAGVIHEIKNPLTVMMTNLALTEEAIDELRRRHDDEALSDKTLQRLEQCLTELEESLDSAACGGARVQEIIEDVQRLSRGEESQCRPVDIQQALDIALRMTRGEFHNGVTLEATVQDVPPVIADETRLSQVFVNLILNALQAMKGMKSAHLSIVVEPAGDDHSVIRFIDTGPGIDFEDQAEIFEPFFTTKSPELGMGLGLSLSREIIESFSGSIEVRSPPGEGAEFIIRLPHAPSSL